MKTSLLTDFVPPDSEFFKIIKHLPKPESGGPWIAGGSVWKSIERLPLKCDIDFFFASPQQFEVYQRIFQSVFFRNHILSEKKTKYSITYDFHIYDAKTGFNRTQKIQFVNFKFWPNIETLLGDFDFTACQFGYDGKNLIFGDTSLNDVKNRQIVFGKIHDVVATAYHVKKYLDIGFSINDENVEKFKLLTNELREVVENDTEECTETDDVIVSSEDWHGYAVPSGNTASIGDFFSGLTSSALDNVRGWFNIRS